MCLGPLTTIALACRLDPSLPGKVKEMLWMGGTIQAKGNVSLTGEFNIHKVTAMGHEGTGPWSIDRPLDGLDSAELTDPTVWSSTIYTHPTSPTKQDPEAAHIVLSAFPKSTMIAWEMTERHTVEVVSVRLYEVYIYIVLGSQSIFRPAGLTRPSLQHDDSGSSWRSS